MDALVNGWDADLSDRESGANEGDGDYVLLMPRCKIHPKRGVGLRLRQGP